MRRAIAIVIAVTLIIALAAPAANAHHWPATAAAIGLGSFILGGMLFTAPRRAYAEPVYVVVDAPHVVYSSPTTYVVAPPPQPVYYPHGRYEWTGAQWVWISNPPVPPAPAAQAAAQCAKYTGKFVKTAQGLQPECE